MGANSSISQISRPRMVTNSPFAYSGLNNLPPLAFHSIHGENVNLSQNGRVARRFESFCKGVVFSNRPVHVNERVYLRFVEITTNWSGGLRFGFTSNDPSKIHCTLPKYACPDLTNKPGFWAKALVERYVVQDSILFYYVTENGDVFYGINGEEKGLFFGGVDVKVPLWSILDIYGNTIAVEFVDPRPSLNNNRPSFENLTAQIGDLYIETLEEDQSNDNTNDACFHKLHGRNVILSENRTLAKKNNTKCTQGYVFTSRSLRPAEVLVVEFIEEESAYSRELAFGLTNCDPGKLTMADLPDDPEALIDRQEYWIVRKDILNSTRPGDSLYFRFLVSGEVQMSKNQIEYDTLMYVDSSQELWAFFDIFGKTEKLRIKEMLPPPSSNNQAFVGEVHQTNIVDAAISFTSPSKIPHHKSQVKPEKATLGECVICFENEINSVIYTCGHMCMCMKCALAQRKREDSGSSGNSGYCPICRQPIQDIIRIYHQ